MSSYLLYLDDVHTRGSDFVLPIKTRAMLTLGRGMQKDKLLQTAMRLRQLGSGQSLVFVASIEVDLLLQKLFSSNMKKSESSALKTYRPEVHW